MKITTVNDLHLDIGPTFPTLPGGDVLILAGDTCEARELKKHEIDRYGIMEGETGFKFLAKNRINQFFEEECSKYEHVIMVAGNHEHYNSVFEETIDHIKANVPDHFHVLEKDCFELDDVLFMGATLWTDMNGEDPLTMHAVKYGMNDFEQIKKLGIDKHYKTTRTRLNPFDVVEDHRKALEYFKVILGNPANATKKVVIVTHHAPTHMSIHPDYVSDYLMNGAYYTRLDDFILDHPQIHLWCHGHVHNTFDYMVGPTRVVCNPRGYQMRDYLEQTGFDPNLVIEL